MTVKHKLPKIISQIHPTKREKAFENLNHIILVICAAPKNLEMPVFLNCLVLKKIEELKLGSSFPSRNLAEIGITFLKTEVLLTILKPIQIINRVMAF